jgi:hypothetical protein
MLRYRMLNCAKIKNNVIPHSPRSHDIDSNLVLKKKFTKVSYAVHSLQTDKTVVTKKTRILSSIVTCLESHIMNEVPCYEHNNVPQIIELITKRYTFAVLKESLHRTYVT